MFEKSRKKLSRRGIRLLFRFGGINPLSNAHSEIGIMNSDLMKNGEIKVLEVLNSHYKNPIIFDVGANVGSYARLVKKCLPNSSVYCFEPNPSSFKDLEKISDIKPFNYALGNSIGDLDLYIPTKNDKTSHATFIKDALFRKSLIREKKVSISTLEKFCLVNRITHIDFLKIDTEGYELEVLKGAKSMLTKISVIQFEMNYHFVFHRVFLKDFYNLLPEYDFFRITAKGLIHLFEYNPIDEIFQMHNILAVHNSISSEWKSLKKW